jgi:hypothetical protein
MRRFVLAALLLLPLPTFAQPASGVYDLAGTNPDGTPYSGLLMLIERGRGAYQVEWNVSGQRIVGWGMAQGDALAASYVLDGRIGVVLYRQSGDVWRGIWSVAGGSAGAETLSPR